jgi:hypothetical protein
MVPVRYQPVFITALRPPHRDPVRPCSLPTLSVQGGPHVCSVLGRTCLGPAGGDAEPWQGVCPQGMAGQVSQSPHILPVIGTHESSYESGGRWGWWVLMER